MPSLNRAAQNDLPVSGQSQQVSALLRLRELLLSGVFMPGERMAEIPLAARLKVSRTPLRLALTALQHEGLLDLHPTRGFVVRAFQMDDIYDSIEIRGVLEGMAARLAVERLPADKMARRNALSELRDCVALLDETILRMPGAHAESFEEYIALNERFHQILLGLAQSDTLSHEMDRILGLPFASPSGFVRIQAEIAESRKILQIGQDQHHAIAEAIEDREATRAENLMREHARLARKNLEIVFANDAIHDLLPGLRLIKDAPIRGKDSSSAAEDRRLIQTKMTEGRGAWQR